MTVKAKGQGDVQLRAMRLCIQKTRSFTRLSRMRKRPGWVWWYQEMIEIAEKEVQGADRHLQMIIHPTVTNMTKYTASTQAGAQDV